MNKIILTLMLLVGFTLSGCKEGKSEESKAVTELKAKCAALTKTDDRGRIYESVSGKIIKNKITAITNHRATGMLRAWEISLINGNNEVILKSEPSEGVKIEQDMEFLNKEVFLKLENQDSNNYQYGVCAHKDKKNQNIFEIQSLRLLKGDK